MAADGSVLTGSCGRIAGIRLKSDRSGRGLEKSSRRAWCGTGYSASRHAPRRRFLGQFGTGVDQDDAERVAATLFGWREAGKTTLFVSAGLRRLDGDARLFLFLDRRREWLYQLSASATLRQFTLWGFAPLERVGWERNASTVGIYDYRRISADFGVTRAF